MRAKTMFRARVMAAVRATVRGTVMATVALGIVSCVDIPLPAPPKPKVDIKTLVDTKPRGARCTITGKNGGTRVFSPPALVSLYQYHPPIRIDCRGAGAWDMRETVFAGTNRPLIQRLLAGEMLSLAASGARGSDIGPGGEYPSQIVIVMPPDRFSTPQERDQAYAALAQEVTIGWDAVSREVRRECRRGLVPKTGESLVSLPDACRKAYKRLDELLAADLQRLEILRRGSMVP
jgi:hypothetical protein